MGGFCARMLSNPRPAVTSFARESNDENSTGARPVVAAEARPAGGDFRGNSRAGKFSPGLLPSTE
jgi:hypothetical protein